MLVWPFASLTSTPRSSKDCKPAATFASLQSRLAKTASLPLVSSPSPCSTDFFHAHAHAHHALAPACGPKQATCSRKQRMHAPTHSRTGALRPTQARNRTHAHAHAHATHALKQTQALQECKKRPVCVPFSSTTTRTVTSCKHRSTESARFHTARFHTDPTRRPRLPTHASLYGLALALALALASATH